jgi:hypothetical protein
MAQRDKSTRTVLSYSERSKDPHRLLDDRTARKQSFFALQIPSDELT